ncbi:MAG: GNAT family N-acetyltransferase [Candidatus Eremiobacteraeota bacterium]|nr:GNAT family N-acetyltransferase [Candidatus Eremiobacteraeota bacterium]
MREARPGDAAFVAELVPRFVEHGAADGHTRLEVIDGTRRVLRAALTDPQRGDVFLIAEDEHGDLAGFVYAVAERDFFTDEQYLHVSEIATVRSGGGVGAALMEAAETHARERGYRFVTLNVVDENTAASRFYERHGYAIGHHHFVKRLSL